MSLAAGADMLGFLVGQEKPTVRTFIEPEAARAIIAELPAETFTVLVTTVFDATRIIGLAEMTAVKAVQFHGGTDADGILKFKKALPHVRAWKVVNVFDETAIAEVKSYEGIADAVTLDTGNRATGQVGGTGQTHDWSVSRRVVESTSLPIILAGGLNPENVEEAIRTVHPYAVDVNSGVTTDGKKDAEKLKQFIRNAKGI